MFTRVITKHKQLWTSLISQFSSDTANKANAYIPIRPLREQRNQLFSINQSNNLPFLVKLVSMTPFLAFSLQGLTSEWNWWIISGCAFGLYFAASSVNMINFYRAHQAFQIYVNKNMTKYEFYVNKNYFSERWEKTLLKSQKKTFSQRFKERLKEGTLDFSEEIIQQLKQLKQEDLIDKIQTFQSSRKLIILEIDRNQIKSFELMSEKKVRELIKQRFIEMRQQKLNPLFQNYSNQKQEKKVLVVQTRPIDGQPIMIFAPLDKNIDNKYEEYLRALGEGKTIASI